MLQIEIIIGRSVRSSRSVTVRGEIWPQMLQIEIEVGEGPLRLVL